LNPIFDAENLPKVHIFVCMLPESPAGGPDG